MDKHQPARPSSSRQNLFASLLALAGAFLANSVGAQTAPPVAEAVSPGRTWIKDRPDYFAPLDFSWNDGRWWWTTYGGVVANNYISQVIRANPNFGGTYLVAATVGREWAKWWEFRFESELGVSLQFGKETIGDFRTQILVLRFVGFPWNDYVYTTFAMGQGPSVMTSKSRYEQENAHETKVWNWGVFWEATFADPQRPDWAAVFRLHHRSPLYDMFKYHGNTTDFVTLGVKHRF